MQNKILVFHLKNTKNGDQVNQGAPQKEKQTNQNTRD